MCDRVKVGLGEAGEHLVEVRRRVVDPVLPGGGAVGRRAALGRGKDEDGGGRGPR